MEYLKKAICEIIDMNGGDFIYAPSVSMYTDRDPILSCNIIDSITGENRSVQDYKGNIMREIHNMTEKMETNRAYYKKERRVQLKKELAYLEE